MAGQDVGQGVGVVELERQYEAFRARKLNLDMTRGKPCAKQLDLSDGMLDCVKTGSVRDASGQDARNYGGLGGIPEARALMGAFLEVAPDEVIVHGNSSLNLMYDFVANALLKGVPGGQEPWVRGSAVRFACPAPGYDRHFSICQHFGIEMPVVELRADGPDMDAVEKLVASDPNVKAIWCVPKYGNPTGTTYSDAAIERLARMRTAAPDFRILWDNAYTVHHLTDTPDRLADILAACKAAGHPDRVILFGSTSKVSYAGGGLAAMGGSRANVDWMLGCMGMQTIGPDKVNQLRHVRFFGDMAGIAAHMRKHAAIVRPKFDAVLEILDRELGGRGVATWNRPNGGYFISVDTLDGCAADVVRLCAEAGVKFTKAGATFPLGKDPRNRNIRIAPTLPELDEIRQATELFSLCVRLVSARKAG